MIHDYKVNPYSTKKSMLFLELNTTNTALRIYRPTRGINPRASVPNLQVKAELKKAQLLNLNNITFQVSPFQGSRQLVPWCP